MGKRDAIIMLSIPLAVVVIPLLLALFIPSIQKARREADQAVSMTNIKAIDAGCYLYSEKNNGQWPDNLEVLVKQEYLPAERLVNPSRPELKEGYVYIKPAKPAKEWPPVLMIYEGYDKWGDGINTSLGFISDEGEFKKLLAEANKARQDAIEEKGE